MDTLKRYGIVFGFSTCYHSKNTQPADMETPEELYCKCRKPASDWAPVADGLWEGKEKSKRKRFA